MKVKVGNKIYDGETEPIMVILSETNKKQIAQMGPDSTKYCVFPTTEEWTKDDYKLLKEWMDAECLVEETEVSENLQN